MNTTSAQPAESFHIIDPEGVDDMAKYEEANVRKEVDNNCPKLNSSQHKQLSKLLTKFEKLFDGTLGTWKNTKYDVELKPGPTPYHGKPYSIHGAYKQQLQVKVD
eukprot:13461168-Ditylum_brightwellii.AAC.1